MRNKKGHRPDQGDSGDNQHHSDYFDESRLSRLQSLVVGFLAMTQSPYLDGDDRALAWAGFDKTLRQLVEVCHDAG